eukprot:TRINITY_DN3669_c0_g1_i1.p1 TRINITY_DN3669_c0_g1~~TRINITY_DN3669_c0_g1_i1.p1  ORF type:complete len:775 (-),score=190.20 TRINITY_DN3669_c0_g1_i1:23-2245(-)
MVGAAVVLVATVVTVVLLTSTSDDKDNEQTPFGFDQVFDSTLQPKGYTHQWLSKDSFTYLSAGDLILFEARTQSTSVVVSRADLSLNGVPVDIDAYAFSPDLQYLLVATNTTQVWRYSFEGVYVVYDVAEKTTRLLSLTNEIQRDAKWSADARHISYVSDNNVWIVDTLDYSEYSVTSDGEKNEIINGLPDWVYEEELLDNASWWSPDGSILAFLRFDESEVNEFSTPIYNGDSYTDFLTIKYPKAGERNSNVTVHIHRLSDQSTLQINLTVPYEYIATLDWANATTLAIRTLNRNQNEAILSIVDVISGSVLATHRIVEQEWWDSHNCLRFLSNGQTYTDKYDVGDKMHIVLIDTLSGLILKDLTPSSDVISCGGIQNNHMIFVGVGDTPMNRSLFRVDLSGNSGVVRFSDESVGWCSVSSPPDSFDAEFGYFIFNYGGPDIPYVALHSFSTGGQVTILENNNEIRENIGQYDIPAFEYFDIVYTEPQTNKEIVLKAMRQNPKNYKKSKKYPVLINVYGGPGSQRVTFQWKLDWHTYMASSQQVIVVTIDGRGCGGRGADWMKTTYLNLGKYESADYVNAAKVLAKMSDVDETKIALWGWSFGGYMGGKVRSEADSESVCATAAVAPVTDWKWYDTLYTERFMRTPQENPAGYFSSSLINVPDSFQGKFLLIHGTLDDNVHFQHAAELSKVLVEVGYQFDSFFYTNQNHRINTNGANTHIYEQLTRFFMEAFGAKDITI